MKKQILAVIALSATAIIASAQSTDQIDAIATDKAAISTAANDSLIISSSVDSRLDGEWTVYNLRGDKVTGEERPFITIALNEGRFYGNNGCNIVNGQVDAIGRDRIKFTNILSTRRLCQDAPFEYLIHTTLGDVRYYSIKQYGHEYYLDLENSRHQVIMVLRQHNMNFLNGAWRVTSIDSTPNRNEGVELVIDIPEARVHGNTGCNIVNGEVAIDPDKPNSIQFLKLMTTRMACPDMSTETSFLVALEEVETAYADGNDNVIMRDNHGREVLRMTRIPIDRLRNE